MDINCRDKLINMTTIVDVQPVMGMFVANFNAIKKNIKTNVSPMMLMTKRKARIPMTSAKTEMALNPC